VYGLDPHGRHLRHPLAGRLYPHVARAISKSELVIHYHQPTVLPDGRIQYAKGSVEPPPIEGYERDPQDS
jgi:hypothetical protein